VVITTPLPIVFASLLLISRSHVDLTSLITVRVSHSHHATSFKRPLHAHNSPASQILPIRPSVWTNDPSLDKCPHPDRLRPGQVLTRQRPLNICLGRQAPTLRLPLSRICHTPYTMTPPLLKVASLSPTSKRGRLAGGICSGGSVCPTFTSPTGLTVAYGLCRLFLKIYLLTVFSLFICFSLFISLLSSLPLCCIHVWLSA